MENWMEGKTTSPRHGNDSLTTPPTELLVTRAEGHFTSSTFYVLTVYMWNACLPVIFALGTFGNTMTILIMRRMRSEESTIGVYFTATAVMDLLYLLTLGVPEWLYCQLGYSLISTHDTLFKVHSWVYTSTSTIGCWCLVCMTVHRAASVVWPLRVNVLCTRRAVLTMLTAVTVSLTLLYSHHVILLLDRVSESAGAVHYCGKTSEDYVYYFDNVFVFVDMLVYCVLPFVILIVSNGVLVWKLHISVRVAGKPLAHADGDKRVSKREKAANSVALTVMVVSMTFLVLTLPLSIHGIMHHVGRNDFSELNTYSFAETNFIHSLCTLLSLTNSAVNFYLYSLTGRRFRREFLKVMGCGRYSPSPSSRSVTSVTGVSGQDYTRHSQVTSFSVHPHGMRKSEGTVSHPDFAASCSRPA